MGPALVSAPINALGERKTATDRNGNVHTYGYDVVGRFLTDAVTTLGSGVEGSVRRQEVAYDSAGLVFRFTTYDAASGGDEVNQVQRVFDGLGQLLTEYQEHTGAVDDTEPVTSPTVQYAYSFAESGTTNHSRPTSLTYPDTRVVNYSYGTANGLNDTISRLEAVTNDATTYEGYDYLGLATVVRRWHQQGNGANVISLTYIKQSGESTADAGDPYTGLDRFGRIVDQRWIKDSDPTNPLDRFQYGYDPNSNRLYRDNLIEDDYDELYHANGDTNGYDNFDQVTDFRRGPLSDASNPADNIPDTVTNSSRTQGWDFDALGNWETLTTDGNDEDREHNRQNQVTVVGGNGVDFDNNGNMIEDQTGKGLVYDAWNRLVQVKTTPTGTQIRAYAYDALGRRVAEANGTFKQFYYSDQWQVLEEHHWGELVVQYVWSPVYVDALVLRDRDTDANGSLDERLYVQQDANWNVTAVVNPSGTTVHERYVYDAYGTPTRLSGSWGTPGTDLNMVYLHQGGRYESATGLYHFRMRDYSAALGRWVQVDPLSFAAGDSNLYRLTFNGPVSALDPAGLGVFDFEIRLFGQTFYGPSHPNAGGVGDTISAYGSALGVAASGTISGAAAGATTGAATGATIGAIGGAGAGGVGAVPGAVAGAGIGATAGGIGGAFSGFVSSIFADDPVDAAISGGISGAISGPLGGAGSGIGTVIGKGGCSAVTHYTTSAAAREITRTGLLRGNLYATTGRAVATGVAGRTPIAIAGNAAAQFSKPVAMGLFTAYQNAAGFLVGPRGILNLTTGALTRLFPGFNYTAAQWYGLDLAINAAIGAFGNALGDQLRAPH